MIVEKEVIEFFDMLAEGWDADIVKDATKISRILDAAEVKPGNKVLDVACGTGVLVPDYLERNVAKVVGFDISPNMIAIAKDKFAGEPRVEFQCTDIEGLRWEGKFDSAVIYNAFPHFADPQGLIANLAKVIVPGGKLTVAHGMGIERLNAHHSGRAQKVSNGLIETTEMAKLFEPYFEVTHQISEEDIYIVSGTKRE